MAKWISTNLRPDFFVDKGASGLPSSSYVLALYVLHGDHLSCKVLAKVALFYNPRRKARVML